MADVFIQMEMSKLNEKLREKGLNHLKVSVRGTVITVFSEFEGEKENRCKFIKISQNLYELSMATHTGKWEPTPFEGTITELFELVTNDFEWILTDYELEN